MKELSNKRQESKGDTGKNSISPDAKFKLHRHQSSDSGVLEKLTSVKTHYENRDIKSILSVPRYVISDGEYLIKPKEMVSITTTRSQNGELQPRSLFIPLDELEAEEHKKIAATRTWAKDLEGMSSPVKSMANKTVSFNLEVECAYETRPISRQKKAKRSSSPHSKDSKTTRNTEVLIAPRRQADSPIKMSMEGSMPQVDETHEEHRLEEEPNKAIGFGFDLDL